MPISNNDKREITRRLLRTKQKAHDLEITLLFDGKTEEAKGVAEKAAALSTQIDVLLGQMMNEWLGEGLSIIEDIKRTNVSLQASIRQIEQGLNLANNLARALGFIDDALNIGRRLLSV